MSRLLHSLLGLVAAVVLTVVSVTGVYLALDPVAEALPVAMSPGGPVSVAQAAGDAARTFPGLERIERRPSGRFAVSWSTPDAQGTELWDPVSGAREPLAPPSALQLWMKNLHRKLLLDDPGRALVGFTSLLMALLGVTGLAMMARRLGSWHSLARPIRGTALQRWHGELSRIAVAGLLVSALSGLAMSGVYFELLPDGAPEPAQAVQSAPFAGPAMSPAGFPALAAIEVAELRSLTFPAADDPADVFRVVTNAGETLLDRSTGQILASSPAGPWAAVYRWIYDLHTGAMGLVPTLLVAMAAATVPVLAVTGPFLWWARRRSRPAIRRSAGVRNADTVILVGSEGNGTWGFAATLHAALTAAGRHVHVAAMDDLARRYERATDLIVLTATYGDGTAPASASRFLDRLARFEPGAGLRTAVLGFGDRSFPRFCAFADTVEAALDARGIARLGPSGRIDRQSAQAFERWGHDLGRALGIDLVLRHTPERPRTTALVLVDRQDYGQAVNAPTAVLRFAAADRPVLVPRWRTGLPRFAAGDLLGVVPPGSDAPRFYSLASSRSDGLVEICVRLHEGGLCSGHLHALRPGDVVEAFVRHNPAFRPADGAAPVILIGAGSGIGPLAGLIRQNEQRRPMHLYFGARHPESDFLYERDLAGWLADRRLTRLRPAFSRVEQAAHVHHSLAADAEAIRALVAHGAQVVVCGGRDMGRSVAHVLAAVLAPLGLTLADLRQEGRYVEDVY